MANVSPGYTFSGTTDPITYTKLNLLGQPTVSIGTGEVTNANLDSGSGIGYVTGTGGVVTQATSKSTAVTLSEPTGAITMHNASLSDATTVSFTVTNTTVAATDSVIVNHASGGTAGAYLVWANNITANAFNISVRNVSGGALGEAIVIKVSIIKGANS